MDNRGFFLTRHAISRQLAAMPNDLYLIRLIHYQTRRAFPGERLWTAAQLANANTIRFLRARNREGCDVYIQPYAENQNAGYVLVDLDAADPGVVERMRTQGHVPCVVLQTSPSHLQAWICVSNSPLEPALATAVGKLLARAYGGDLASTDWRHLGRLAGFTNQKPERRTIRGYAPWVRVLYAQAGLAPRAETLLRSARAIIQARHLCARSPDAGSTTSAAMQPVAPSTAAAEAIAIYSDCMRRWRIAERFPQPDWSIVDLWIARHLLAQGKPATEVQKILRLASPHFPRGHSDAGDYLRRTLQRAAFSAPRGALCGSHAALPRDSPCSNSTGGR